MILAYLCAIRYNALTKGNRGAVARPDAMGADSPLVACKAMDPSKKVSKQEQLTCGQGVLLYYNISIAS